MAEKRDDTRLLDLMRKRFALCEQAESRNRLLALEDAKFRAGEQWPIDVKAQRDLDRRPCLTVNRTRVMLRQITNELRQDQVSIQVNPVDDSSDPDTAEIIQGVILHIETNSDAEAAYDLADDHMASLGFGYYRILSEYVDDESDDQELIIAPIPNPFSVYIDPAAVKPDRSDMRFAFITARLSIEEYKSQFGEDADISSADFTGIGDGDWFTGDGVRIVEYFYIELDKDPTRKRPKPKVYWIKSNGIAVLERRAWPGRWIPIIVELGDEEIIEGERILSGAIRNAKDAQRAYNYWVTAETEMIALAPKAPWVAAEGQIEGYEHLYAAANNKNINVLPYKPKDVAGNLVPPPQRQSVEPPIQAITAARAQAADDLKSTFGIYDAALGARSNETSGKAILARQRESDVANFHFADNRKRARKHCGRVLLDLIRYFYDSARVMRIIGADDQQKIVPINQIYLDPKEKIEKIYDLTVGRYDITIGTGPSMATRRQEAVESMTQLVQAYPALLQVAGDLMVEHMDWPGARQIAERLKKTLPPELQDQPEGEQPISPQIRAQMAQRDQMIEALTQQLNAATETINTKAAELASRERIEALKIQADLIKTQAQLQSQEGLAMLHAEIQRIEAMLDRDHALELQTSQQQADAAAEPVSDAMPEAA